MSIRISRGMTLSLGGGDSGLAPNLWTFPSNLENAAWTKLRSTVTSDVEGFADKLVEDTTATNTHVLSRADQGIDNTTLTFSGEFKAVERSRFRLFLLDADASANFVQVTVNLGDGTTAESLGGAATIALRAATLLSDGYYRVVFTGVPNPGGAGGVVSAQIRLADGSGNQSYTGDGTSGLLIRRLGLAIGARRST